MPIHRLALLWLATVLGAQTPTLTWYKAIEGSGPSGVAAATVDAKGNFYLYGSTTALDMPTRAAAQSRPGSSPLLRLSRSTGNSEFLFPPGISSVETLADSPSEPSTLYLSSSDGIFRTGDSGTTWTRQSSALNGSNIRGLAVDPFSPGTLYAATLSQGLLKSTDAGQTWSPSGNGLPPIAARITAHPTVPGLLFAVAGYSSSLYRSTDSGASWSNVSSVGINGAFPLDFDSTEPSTIYTANREKIFKSTDGGQFFRVIAVLPVNSFINSLVLASNGLHAGTSGGLYTSTDGGITWTQQLTTFVTALLAAPASPGLYASTDPYGLLYSEDGFRTSTNIAPAAPSSSLLRLSAGQLFAVSLPATDLFLTKLDPSGNVLLSTYLGGTGNDTASAIALGPDGSIFLTGRTVSPNFPTTLGAYLTTRPGQASAPATFLTKISPDGTLAWSTYFTSSNADTRALAVDPSGAPILTGYSTGLLPTTPGTYTPTFNPPPCSFKFCTPLTAAYATRFSPQGDRLLFSTYIPNDLQKNVFTAANTIVLDASGNTWLAGQGNIVALNATGSDLLASTRLSNISISALALDADSNVIATGTFTPDSFFPPRNTFPATPGAFQTTSNPILPQLPGQPFPYGSTDAFVIKWSPNLDRIIAATLLGGELVDQASSLTIDPSGNIIVSGTTDSKAFPTRSPFQSSFAARSGFLATFSPDLTQLLYSTYLGDRSAFTARAAIPDGQGNILLTGNTLSPNGPFVGGQPGLTFTESSRVYANKLALAPKPRFQLDAVLNAASFLATPLSPGQTFTLRGSGFSPDARILIDDVPLTPFTGNGNELTAILPTTTKSSGDLRVQIEQSGTRSNAVFVPAAPASPGIFSVDGSGYGQGYILNADGSLNSPSNPAAPNEKITLFATGAVTTDTPSVYIDGFYANGISSTYGPVDGLPGNVYQLSVTIPNPAEWVDRNPNLKDFKFPPQVGVKLVIGPVNSANPNNSDSTSQNGIILNIK